MFIAIFLVVLAITILYFGAEFSLDASEKFGKKIGLSPLIVGMVLIGFGTSLPELFVGHIAVTEGKPDIAIGSLVGSNIANMFLILGVCGLISPVFIRGLNLRRQLIIHMLLGVSLWWVFSRSSLDAIAVSVLLAVCLLYLYLLFREMRSDKDLHKDHEFEFNGFMVTFKLLVGFGMLYIGGELLVKGGVDLCREIGISEYIVSAIFIAFGTSFPELVTALMAIVKKKDADLIIGNIIGSNLFNCSLIMATLGIYKIEFSENYFRETLALTLGAAYLVALAFRKKDFSKFSASIFLLSYFAMIGSWLKWY